MWKDAKLEEMVGLTMSNVAKSRHDGNDMIVFDVQEGGAFKMHHRQDCCEDVSVESIDGELSWLAGTPILSAYESSNESNDDYWHETWTFYRITTVQGTVVIRWHGQSNGYYSESVDFSRWDV